MKQRIVFTFLFLAIIVSCKKSDVSDNDGPLHITPVPATPVAGIITVSSSRLVLHADDQAGITARVYDGNGILLPVQPALLWGSNNPSVTVNSSGIITAESEGEAVITVSDGVHAKGYINVSVVADNVVIPTGAANISFAVNAVSIPINGDLPVPAYTLTDNKGNLVGGTPSFELKDFPNAQVVNNNTIHGSGTGSGMLMAKFNGAYLAGGLPVYITTPGVVDTFVSFGVLKFPTVFNYYNETAPLIQISVIESWTNSSGVHFKFYETTPDDIVIDHPNIIDATADGHLVSKYPGITKVKVGYKDVEASYFAGVHIDLTGSWSGTKSGVTYNLCVQRIREPIYFNQPNYTNTAQEFTTRLLPFNLNLETVNGTAFVSGATTTDFYFLSNVGMIFPSNTLNNYLGAVTTMDATIGQVWIHPSPTGMPMSFISKWQNDINKFKMGDILLTRGGNCGGGGSGSLAQTLCNGSSKTWGPNACYFEDFDINTITYRSDSTGTVSGSGFSSNFTWSVTGNSSVKMSEPEGYVIYYVAAYSPDAVSFSRIHEYDNTQTPPNDHDDYYTGVGGCIYGLID